MRSGIADDCVCDEGAWEILGVQIVHSPSNQIERYHCTTIGFCITRIKNTFIEFMLEQSVSLRSFLRDGLACPISLSFIVQPLSTHLIWFKVNSAFSKIMPQLFF